MGGFGLKPWSRQTAPAANPQGLLSEAERLAMRLPPLLVEAERIAATIAQGVHGRRRVGSGESFWQFRRFRDEDASTSIDWRQSAKSPHLFVREREWEAAETVWLWRDGSRSMHYRSPFAPCSKIERATVLSLALSSLLVRAGERVAVLGGADGPAHGRLGINRVSRAMTKGLDAALPSKPPQIALHRFSQAVLFGDWLEEPEATTQTVHYYSSRGVRGHMLQVLDPAEEDLPFDGRTEFEDVEGPLKLIARRAETMRDQYKAKLAALRVTLSQYCRRQNWTFATHRTDRAPQTALLALYAAMSAHRPMGGGASHV